MPQSPGEYVMAQEHYEYQPWYRLPDRPHPFRLSKKISSNDADAPDYRSAACFPWDQSSLADLWRGSLNIEENQEPWKAMILECWDAVAVGADHRAYIFFTHRKRKPICISLPKEPPGKLIEADKICLAWALVHHAPFEPLLILSRGSLLYVFNLNRAAMAGYLRGHGGAITSISVHPTMTHLFCTTSRDTSTRIYDLTLPPIQYPNNPHWPPSKRPSLAGAAHGLHMNEAEGSGIGRCIIVLVGGRSGGHQAAVLGAAFHKHFPIIATCGMDRNVKIWAIRPASRDQITREDKPLFSSGRIHKARVLSVTWLQDDVLLTHSAPAVMRFDPHQPLDKRTYLEPGELIVWRWLGLNRFFPLGSEEVNQTVLRGCASDYQESSSFKFIAVYRYPPVASQYVAPHVHVFQSATHDPLVLSTSADGSGFLITNVTNLKPRKMPSIFDVYPELNGEGPEDNGGDRALATITEHIHLTDADRTEDSRPKTRNSMKAASKSPDPDIKLPAFQPDPIFGWEVGLDSKETSVLNCTAVTCEGQIIVGVGSKGTVWVWRLKSEDSP